VLYIESAKRLALEQVASLDKHSCTFQINHTGQSLSVGYRDVGVHGLRAYTPLYLIPHYSKESFDKSQETVINLKLS